MTCLCSIATEFIKKHYVDLELLEAHLEKLQKFTSPRLMFIVLFWVALLHLFTVRIESSRLVENGRVNRIEFYFFLGRYLKLFVQLKAKCAISLV